MNTDLASTLLTARTTATQQSVQIAVVKQAHDMQMELINALMETALSPPPPGQGTRIDKLA